jgi:very-short-patch-repair endonuclease
MAFVKSNRNIGKQRVTRNASLQKGGDSFNGNNYTQAETVQGNISSNFSSGLRPLNRTGSFNSGKTVTATSNTTFTQPHFYSPLHTPQNWQIPSRRNEIYQWCRYFFENEPKVAAAIQFYSEFPMQGFELQTSDTKVKRFYEEVNKKLKLEYWLPVISSEYFLLGDVFPFLGISCPHCGGQNPKCDHKGGTFNKLVVLNPDWIEVKQNVLADEPYIQLIPNEELKKIVMDKFPIEVFNKIPDRFRKMIISGMPIPLSNRSVTHLKHLPVAAGTYGTSIVRRLFKTLAYKDRLMTANWIISERLILPIRIVKIGNDDRPAGQSDIANVQQQLAAVQNDPNLTLVTHHAFQYEFAGANGSIIQLQAEYEMITKELLDGLMLPQAVLNSEMAGYQGVQIGAEILLNRLENWRLKLKTFIEEQIYLPIAKMQGFIDEEASKDLGYTVYSYPKVKWNDMHIRDDTQKKQQYLGLHDAGLLSAQTLMEMFDLDYDQEIERKREEANIQASLGGGVMGGGMDPMGGGMPPMGGGMPPMDMGGGGMPPMDPMGGDMGAGGMPGGDMGAGGAPPVAAAGGTGGKIMKRHSKNRLDNKQDEQAGSYAPQQIQLTSIEKVLFNRLFSDPSVQIPYRKFAQFKVANAFGQPFVLDFAIPDLKIDIEADGELHRLPENKARDEKRDQRLANKGWTILRFTDHEIKEKTDQVIQSIMGHVHARSQQMKQMKRKNASNALNGIYKTLEKLSGE